MSNPIISQKIKQLRIDRGLTQKEVYEKMGVSQSTFSSWELGKSEPSALAFLKLCRIYGVSDILLEFTGDSLNNDISKGEYSLIKKYRLLNEDGQQRLDSTLDDLLKIDQYRKDHSQPDLGEIIERAEQEHAAKAKLVAHGGFKQYHDISDEKLAEIIKKAEEQKRNKRS